MRMVKTTTAVLALFTAMGANMALFAAEETVVSATSEQFAVDTESYADASATIALDAVSDTVNVAYSARAWDASAAMRSCSLYDNGVLVASFDGEGEYTWSPSYGTHELSLSVEGGETFRREFFRDYPADFVVASSSSPISMDTRAGEGTLEAKDSELIHYSSFWAADANATATVTLNGAPFAGGKGEGVAEWVPTAAGTYTFQHTTAGSDETLTATFTVMAKDIALLKEVFSDLPVNIAPDGEGGWIVTLTNNVSGTVEIPDNVGAVIIDLNGRDMVGGGGLGETALPGPAILIVAGEGEGNTTQLTIVDTSEGEKGQIAGGGESAGIEVAEDAATGVKLDVEDGVGVFNGDGSEQELKPKLIGTGKVTVSGDGKEAKEPKLTRTAYYPLTVICATEGGTVSGTGVYAEGKKVTIKATAAKGYVFAGWYDESVKCKMENVKLEGDADEQMCGSAALTIDAKGKISGKLIDADGTWTLSAPWFDGVRLAPLLGHPLLGRILRAERAAQAVATGVPSAGGYGDGSPHQDPEAGSPMSDVGSPVFVATVIGKNGKMAFTNEMEVAAEDGVGVVNGRDATPARASPSATRAGPCGRFAVRALRSADLTTSSQAHPARGICSPSETGETPPLLGHRLRRLAALGGYVLPVWTAWQYNWKVEPWKTLGKEFDKKTRVYAILADGSFSEDEAVLTSALGAEVTGRVTLKFAASGTVSVSGEFVTGYDEKKQKYTIVKATGSATLVPLDEEHGAVFIYLTPKGLAPHARTLVLPW